jgi:FkbM family methyltransferase
MSYRDMQNDLNTLLASNPEACVSIHKEKFKNHITNERPPILFGAGRLGKTVIAGLRKAGIEPIVFTDNNPDLWGKKMEGIEVISPVEAVKQFSQNTFVVSVYTAKPVREQLRRGGIREISFPELAWLFPEQFLPHGALDHPDKLINSTGDVKRAYQLWADEASQTEYLGQIAWRMTLDDSTLPPNLPQGEIYFSDIILSSTTETFVDCGSFDGDTIREFIKRHSKFNSIVAIEPDQINFRIFQSFTAGLPVEQATRISAFNNAVGAQRGTVQFNETGSAASAIGTGSYSVECITLDELLEGKRPSYIKMDIEGAELDALKGTQKTIQTHEPVLAICLYHKQEHLWEIPLLLHSFFDQYSFFLRRYSDHCWESVCYAVPPERLK